MGLRGPGGPLRTIFRGAGGDGGGATVNGSASWKAPKATLHGLKERWGVGEGLQLLGKEGMKGCGWCCGGFG